MDQINSHLLLKAVGGNFVLYLCEYSIKEDGYVVIQRNRLFYIIENCTEYTWHSRSIVIEQNQYITLRRRSFYIRYQKNFGSPPLPYAGIIHPQQE